MREMHVQRENESENSLFSCFEEEREKEMDCWTLAAAELQVNEFPLLLRH